MSFDCSAYEVQITVGKGGLRVRKMGKMFARRILPHPKMRKRRHRLNWEAFSGPVIKRPKDYALEF